MPASLSASQFLSGLQCHKRLYLDIHSPDLATEIDDVLQGRFDMGTEVGILAHGRFPGGALVADRDLSQALEHTARLVQDSSFLAEERIGAKKTNLSSNLTSFQLIATDYFSCFKFAVCEIL